MSDLSACDCAETLAGALGAGASATPEAVDAGTEPRGVCLWCGGWIAPARPERAVPPAAPFAAP